MNGIVSCMLHLPDASFANKFLKSNPPTLDVNAICACPDVQRRMAFVRTFLTLFGCPPSHNVLIACLDNPVGTIPERWPFVSAESVHREFTNTLNVIRGQRVRETIVDLITHYDKKGSRDSTNLVTSFLRVFGNVKNWQDIDQQLDECLSGWYLLSRCIGGVCVVCENEEASNAFLSKLVEIIPSRVHVFSTNTNGYSPSIFPLHVFKHVVCVSDTQVRIKNDFVMKLANRQDAVAHVIKGLFASPPTCTEQYKRFWERVGTLWDKLDDHTSCIEFTDDDSENAVIAFETRKNPLTVMSCMLTCRNLDRQKWRGVVMFCNRNHVDYYKSALGNVACEVVGMDELTISHFTLDDYNDLLKSERVWEILWEMKVKRVLLVQDDGFLVRPGVERFLEWDYVGAPWREGQSVLQSMTSVDLVGNGGLSLRSVSAMMAITRRHKTKERWPGTWAQTPEDTHFAKYVKEDGHRLCPRTEATMFASEQVCRRGCCGVHKPWPYLSTEEIDALFK